MSVKVVAIVFAFSVGVVAVRLLAMAGWQQAVVDGGPVEQRVIGEGVVEPRDGIVEVRARTDGPVQRVDVRVGDHVRAGDLLAEVREDGLVAEVSQRDAEHRAAAYDAQRISEGVRPEARAVTQAQVESARRELALAEDRASRQARLKQTGSTSDADEAEAERTLDIARSRLATTEAELALVRAGGSASETRTARAHSDAAKAALQLAEAALSRTRIIAPVDGVVLERHVNPGDTVTGSATGGPPLPLFEIADTAHLEARLELDGHDVNRLATGQSVTLSSEGGGERLAVATLSRIAPRMEPRTLGIGSARVRADGSVRMAWATLEPPAGASLVIGQRLEASVVLARRQSGARVPRRSIQMRDGRSVVDVVWGLFVREIPVVVEAVNQSYADVRGVARGERVLLH